MHTLDVEGMSCGGCAARVTRAVHALDPHATVEVLLKDRLVHVESKESPDAVAAAMITAGYAASTTAQA